MRTLPLTVPYEVCDTDTLGCTELYTKLAVPANFVLPQNVSLANDYSKLRKALVACTRSDNPSPGKNFYLVDWMHW